MKFLFTLLLSFSFTIHSYGQTMTAYEKKTYLLTVQFLRKLGVDEAILKKSSKMSDLEKLIIASNFLEKLNTELGLKLFLEYERYMKEAEILKTTVDIQRDREKKAEADWKKKIELVNQKEKQRQADLEDQEKEKIELYKNSDYSQIKIAINQDYNSWLQKDEFEKTEDYQIRISNNSSRAFDSVCYKILASACKTKSNFSKHLLMYNADTEMFGIIFFFNNINLSDSLKIPLKIAAKFKEEFGEYRLNIAEKDWAFIDNYLIPRKITIVTNDKVEYDFYFSKKNIRDISFVTTDFDFILPTDSNTKFDYYKYCNKRVFVSEDEILRNNGSGNGPRVTNGDRKIVRSYSFEGDLEKATIYANVSVSSEGIGKFVNIAKGSSNSSNPYKEAIIRYLQNIRFDKSDHESMVTVRFNFTVN